MYGMGSHQFGSYFKRLGRVAMQVKGIPAALWRGASYI
jgi:hypothetical protein